MGRMICERLGSEFGEGNPRTQMKGGNKSEADFGPTWTVIPRIIMIMITIIC